MPNAFVDQELIDAFQKIKSNEKTKTSKFSAHSFEASCLKVGLSLRDLKERTYVSIMKVLFSFIDTDSKEKEIKDATQKDIDKFMS